MQIHFLLRDNNGDLKSIAHIPASVGSPLDVPAIGHNVSIRDHSTGKPGVRAAVHLYEVLDVERLYCTDGPGNPHYPAAAYVLLIRSSAPILALADLTLPYVKEAYAHGHA